MITLTLLLTLLLCLNTTYATDNSNNTLNTQNPSKTIDETNTDTITLEKANTKEICQENENTIQTTTSKGTYDTESISKENENTIQRNKKDNDNKQTESQNYKIIEDSTYSNYFSKSGNIIGDTIKNGDTIDIKGIITNKNFNINRQVTFTTTSNGKIINGSIKLSSGANNSTISNLYIQNSQDNGIGISLISVSNVTVQNNTLKMNGTTGYGLMATHSTYLQIINNTITQNPTSSDSVHNAILMGDCHYNTISQNKIEITKISAVITTHNGIYFSTYDNTNANFDGGYCNYNNITNNIIKGVDTTMCYTIQIMGNHNLAQNNTVFKGAIGISSAGSDNKIINNNIHGTVTGIAVGDNNEIIGNIINLNNGAIGISINSNNNLIQNNKINTTNKPGINLKNSASNNTLKNNTIISKSNGICIQGTGAYNNITENTITSENTGILFRQQSKKSSPSNNSITCNDIETTNAEYAINAYESKNTFISKNRLISTKGTGNDAIRFSEVNSGGSELQISGKTYNLNDTNYLDYFYLNGTLKENIGLQDTFNLNGPLYNKNLTITVPIIINGNQNTIYNGTITVLEDGAETKIKNLKIVNDNQIGIILENTESVIVENNNITVNQVIESYGIYLHASDYNIITNNKITSRGDFVNFGILLYSSNNNQIIKNNVNTISCDIEIPYQDSVMLNDKIGIIPQIFTTYGIIAIYSSKNKINDNIVNLSSLFTEAKNVTENCSNSMVGIDIYYNSHYNTANNNQVNVIGNNPYSYGMGVLGSGEEPTENLLETAKENAFGNNNINVFGNYFATGFIAGLGSIDTIINNNIITVKSNTVTYGVTFEASQRSTLISNNITVDSPAIYGIELYVSNDNTIHDNSINAIGYYKYGLVGYSSSENEIINNKITTKSSKIEPSITKVQHGDAVSLGDTGILLIKDSNSNLIKLNKITTDSEYTINLTKSENNTITENSLLAKEKIASKSVFYDSPNKIENNEGYSLSIETDDIVSSPGSKITLKAFVNSTSGNSDGLKVTFTIGITNIGTNITKNGVAEINYKIPANWKYTYYNLKVDVSGEDYITKSITKTLELKKLNDDPINETQPTETQPTETPIEPKQSEDKTTATKTPKTQENANKVTLTATKVTKVSKKAKKLVLTTKLKIGKTKNNNGKTVTYIINGKKYKTKTKNGVAKITIKKADLKKLINKTKVGKNIKYKIMYGKTTVTKYIKVKK